MLTVLALCLFPLLALLLKGLIQALSSKPFYMDSPLIRLIIRQVPHVLVTIQSQVGIVIGHGCGGGEDEKTEQTRLRIG